MTQSSLSKPEAAEERTEQTRSFVRRVRAATRRKYTPEEKIRVVLEGFRREVTVNRYSARFMLRLSALCRVSHGA